MKKEQTLENFFLLFVSALDERSHTAMCCLRTPDQPSAVDLRSLSLRSKRRGEEFQRLLLSVEVLSREFAECQIGISTDTPQESCLEDDEERGGKRPLRPVQTDIYFS